jgi:hypothetical protein
MGLLVAPQRVQFAAGLWDAIQRWPQAAPSPSGHGLVAAVAIAGRFGGGFCDLGDYVVGAASYLAARCYLAPRGYLAPRRIHVCL